MNTSETNTADEQLEEFLSNQEAYEHEQATLREKINQMISELPQYLWNDSVKEPDDREHCLLHYGGNKYCDFELAFYNAKDKCFMTENYPHPTDYKVEQHAIDGGVVVERYKNKRDKISISDVVRWCKLSDLI